MNHHNFLRTAAIAGLVFAAPVTGFTKDKHHHHHGHSSYVQPYCAPYASHGYHSSYYSRPSLSLGFYSAPSYYSSPDYYYDSYPTTRTYYPRTTSYSRTYYPRTSYSRTYRSSSYNDDLAVDVQRALARRGYYRGGIDGDIGPGTRAAIRSYQYNRGLEVTGRIDGALLRSLGIS